MYSVSGVYYSYTISITKGNILKNNNVGNIAES